MAAQWYMFGLNEMPVRQFHYTEEEAKQLVSLFEKKGYTIISEETENVLAYKAREEFPGKYSYKALFCALYDEGRYIGNIMFKKETDMRADSLENIDRFKAFSNLLGIYYAKHAKEGIQP